MCVYVKHIYGCVSLMAKVLYDSIYITCPCTKSRYLLEDHVLTRHSWQTHECMHNTSYVCMHNTHNCAGKGTLALRCGLDFYELQQSREYNLAKAQGGYYRYACVCMSTCMYVYVCPTCTYAYICICMYIYMCVYNLAKAQGGYI